MKINVLLFTFLLVLCSCAEDDSFSISTGDRLTFSTDTVSMDTVFSTVPTRTQTFWVYNHTGDNLRCSSVRQEQGSTTGFRVNVDGTYLSSSSNYQTQNVEIRKGDSLRVYVELTSKTMNATDPKKIEDNLVFTLENGTQQKVNLNAFCWDAELHRNWVISKNTTITADKPVVIYGGLKVDSAATLTLAAGAHLYFHGDAAMTVYGRVKSEGTAEKNVVLRGDRLDNMFDYLPYDLTAGQWEGLHLMPSSYGNSLSYTDLHSPYDGIVCDSSSVEQTKLAVDHSTIHNCQGSGIKAVSAKITVENTEISNVLDHCVDITGGSLTMNQCTLAQFYPFSLRGTALQLTAIRQPLTSMVRNSIVTGYADDEISIAYEDTTVAKVDFRFDHCLLRTPRFTTADSLRMTNIIYEDVKDTTIYGEKNFILFDTDKLRYNFALKATSAAIGKADPATALPYDRNGLKRDDEPDMGCYEFNVTNK
ncbi:MAG: choice-of-anchor Q domain-containing protein [Prevotellaceae bacterium]|nr:choice-of-anchor Q domain-containing protein [Prevotellaceae bacterium]